MTKLPDKASDLIQLALDDLARVEAQPERYAVNMYNWHLATEEGRCSVCFAGAVMAGTLGVPSTESAMPTTFDKDTCDKLSALDSFRHGLVDDGLNAMSQCAVSGRLNRSVTEYQRSPRRWREQMVQLVHDLRKVGL